MNRVNALTFRLLAAFCFASLAAISPLSAADAFRAGESVAFLHDEQWYVGTIVQVERGRALVSAELDGETSQGVFSVSALRRPLWTVGSRFWSDQSGKFRVKASVVDVTPDSLRLLKIEGDTVAVPIKRLSESDQAIAAKLVAAKQAYEASLPKADQQEMDLARSPDPRMTTPGISRKGPAVPSRSSESSPLEQTQLANLLASDTKPALVIDLDKESLQHQKFFKPRTSLLQAPPDMEPLALGVGEPILEDFPEGVLQYAGYRDESIDRLFPIGGPDGRVVVQVTRPAKGVDVMAVRWLSLHSGEASAPFLLAEGEQVACVEPIGGRLLTHTSPKVREDDDDHLWRVYRGNPTESSVRLEVELEQSFAYLYDGDAIPSFLPGNRLLLQGGRDLNVVDLTSGEIVFSFDYVYESQNHCMAHLSPNRRYLVVYFHHDAPTKRLIFDLGNFGLVHCESVPSRSYEAFSPGGKYLVSLQGKKLLWLNVESWKTSRTESITDEWKKTGSPFHVLDQRFLINSYGRLLDLETGQIVTKLSDDGVAGNPRKPPKTAWVGNCLLKADTRSPTKAITSVVMPTGQ